MYTIFKNKFTAIGLMLLFLFVIAPTKIYAADISAEIAAVNAAAEEAARLGGEARGEIATARAAIDAISAAIARARATTDLTERTNASTEGTRAQSEAVAALEEATPKVSRMGELGTAALTAALEATRKAETPEEIAQSGELSEAANDIVNDYNNTLSILREAALQLQSVSDALEEITGTALEEVRGRLGTTEPVEFTSPIGQISPGRFIGNAIKTVLGIIGAIALAIFVYGGFVWMTSGGSPEKIKTAQTTLVWAVLGMIVMFASYAAVDFVLRALGV
jgi:hypothetical protein